jgi:hypothetical protein
MDTRAGGKDEVRVGAEGPDFGAGQSQMDCFAPLAMTGWDVAGPAAPHQ